MSSGRTPATSLFGAGLDNQMDLVRQRDTQADRQLGVHPNTDQCPKCGGNRFSEIRTA